MGARGQPSASVVGWLASGFSRHSAQADLDQLHVRARAGQVEVVRVEPDQGPGPAGPRRDQGRKRAGHGHPGLGGPFLGGQPLELPAQFFASRQSKGQQKSTTPAVLNPFCGLNTRAERSTATMVCSWFW